jgi:ubiquinone/menaquinone biosynthesis C-methylase UbiE
MKVDSSEQKKLIEENIRVHDKIAEDYNSKHGEIFNDVEQKRLFTTLKRALDFIRTDAIPVKALDYGSGSGNVTRHLLEFNIDVVAADVSKHFLALVSEQYSNDRLITLNLNGKDLEEVKTNSFDFITVYSVLHHIPDYLAAITELARVCKPGGVIYLDHEPTEQFWSMDLVYQEFQSAALRIDWKKFFVPANYIGKVRRWFNPKYTNEGDIHVWEDDHIEWEQIKKTLKELGFEIVLSEDYLLYRNLYRLDVYNKYEKLCNDMRVMVFRKRLV